MMRDVHVAAGRAGRADVRAEGRMLGVGGCVVGVALLLSMRGALGGPVTAEGDLLWLTAGEQHTCALLHVPSLVPRNRVKCWGAGSSGELGYEDMTSRGDNTDEMGQLLPFVDLGNLNPEDIVSHPTAGHTCAWNINGLKCWGNNLQGQLGYDDSFHRGDNPGEMGSNLPFVQIGLSQKHFFKVVVGSAHTCAITNDTDTGAIELYCWGANANGQLGQEDTDARGDGLGEMGILTPVDLGSLFGTPEHITSGHDWVCAVNGTGQLKCWGYNGGGQLGLEDTDNRGDGLGEMGNSLEYVDLNSSFGKPSGLQTGFDHSCFEADFGTHTRVKCWGVNGDGQLGYDDTSTRGNAPGTMGAGLPYVQLKHGIQQMATGKAHNCIVTENTTAKNATVRCWGRNSDGQLGYEDTSARGDDPGEMAALPQVNLGKDNSTVLQLAAGGDHTCAMMENATWGRVVKCWGQNFAGQLGYGDAIVRGSFPSTMGERLSYVAILRNDSARGTGPPLTLAPTLTPTFSPAPTTSPAPTLPPTISPAPTPAPTISPAPTLAPTVSPAPTPAPTVSPAPTAAPSMPPTAVPSMAPTISPAPTPAPTVSPAPTPAPTVSPAPTAAPSMSPTVPPTVSPAPTPAPTVSPAPTPAPTVSPAPTPAPTISPAPTLPPTVSPAPTPAPTVSPAPTAAPSMSPTLPPTVSPAPTPAPTVSPAPTAAPSMAPTGLPSVAPTISPAPTLGPTAANQISVQCCVDNYNATQCKQAFGAPYNLRTAITNGCPHVGDCFLEMATACTHEITEWSSIEINGTQNIHLSPPSGAAVRFVVNDTTQLSDPRGLFTVKSGGYFQIDNGELHGSRSRRAIRMNGGKVRMHDSYIGNFRANGGGPGEGHGGGAILVARTAGGGGQDPDLLIDADSAIEACSTQSGAGGLIAATNGTSVRIEDTWLKHGVAPHGGAIAAGRGANVSLLRGGCENNTATESGGTGVGGCLATQNADIHAAFTWWLTNRASGFGGALGTLKRTDNVELGGLQDAHSVGNATGLVHLHNVTADSNTAQQGGGVFVEDTNSVRIHRSTFDANVASGGAAPLDSKGGALHVVLAQKGFPLQVQATSFLRNEAPDFAGAGGAIYLDSQQSGNNVNKTTHEHTFDSCDFQRNQAGGYGGAFAMDGRSVSNDPRRLRFASCVFKENALTSLGPFNGGAMSIGNGMPVSVEHGAFSNNTLPLAGVGGAAIATINASAPAVRISGTTFRNHYAPNRGGTLRFDNAFSSLTDVNIVNSGTGNRGGAIETASSTHLAVHNTTIRSASAFQEGGGIYVGGSLTATKLHLEDCSTTAMVGNGGGGIHLALGGGATHISHSTIVNCRADGTKAGGIYARHRAQPLTIVHSSFRDCTAKFAGAAMYITNTETRVTGGVFANNVAQGSAGAIKHSSGAQLLSINGTAFVDNRAVSGEGGAVEAENSRVRIVNASFVRNTAKEQGGALFVQSAAQGAILSLHDSSFIDNAVVHNTSTAGIAGGALFVQSTNTGNGSRKSNISNCVFRRNRVEVLAHAPSVEALAVTGGGAVAVHPDPGGGGSNWHVHLQDNLFERNEAPAGGALLAHSMERNPVMTMTNNRFIANEAGRNLLVNGSSHGGGAILVQNGSLHSTGMVARDNVVHANSIGGGGGVVDVVDAVDMQITSATWENNTAKTGCGGALRVENISATLVLQNNVARDNQAEHGGAMCIRLHDPWSNATLVPSLTGGELSNNTATSAGGGLFVGDTSAVPLSVRNVVVQHNFADNGAGIHVSEQANVTLTEVTLAENRATMMGGGLATHAAIALARCTVRDNRAHGAGGGGIATMRQNLTITIAGNTTVSNNRAPTQSGGGIFLKNGATLHSSASTTWQGNYAAQHGGAVHANGATCQVHVTGSSMLSNGAGGSGGAIALRNGAVAYLNASTALFQSNFADGIGGGAIMVEGGATLWATNTRFMFNDARGGEGGGAILAEAGGVVHAAGVTFDTNFISGAGLAGGAVLGTDPLTSIDIDSATVVSAQATGQNNIGAGFAVKGGAALNVNGSTTMSGGHANAIDSAGAAVACSGAGTTMCLDGATLTGNSAFDGGGAVVQDQCHATIINTQWQGNAAPNGNGGAMIVRSGGIVNVSTSLFQSNQALGLSSGSGGALYVEGNRSTVWSNGSTFDGNIAAIGNGGAVAVVAVHQPAAFVHISGGQMLYNTAAQHGGAVSVERQSVSFASWADAVGQARGRVVLFDVDLQSNVATTPFISNGGAVYAKAARVEALQCDFWGNNATSGGAIYAVSGAAVSLDDCDLRNNRVLDGVGGAVAIVDASVSSVDTDYTMNRAESGGTLDGVGGAFHASSSWPDASAYRLLEVSRAVIAQNEASHCGALGTASSNAVDVASVGAGGNVTLKHVTLSQNRAQLGAGGAVCFDGMIVTIKDGSKVAQNIAQLHGGFAASQSDVMGAGHLVLLDTRVHSNTLVAGNEGGGVHAHNSMVTIIQSNVTHHDLSVLPSTNTVGAAIYLTTSWVASDNQSTVWLTVRESTISQNRVGDECGAIMLNTTEVHHTNTSMWAMGRGGVASIDSSVISNNTATNGRGGAICADGWVLHLKGLSNLEWNWAGKGGGALSLHHGARLNQSSGLTRMNYNTARTRGGAVEVVNSFVRTVGGTLSMENNAVTQGDGGAVAVMATWTRPAAQPAFTWVELSSSIIKHNSAESDGGALSLVWDGASDVTDLGRGGRIILSGIMHLQHNNARKGNGGAVAIRGMHVHFSDSFPDIFGNMAGSDPGEQGSGGVVYADAAADVMLTGMTLHDNNASSMGGVVYALNSRVRAQGSTLNRNRARGGAAGAIGVSVTWTAAPTPAGYEWLNLHSTALYENTAVDCGAIGVFAPSVDEIAEMPGRGMAELSETSLQRNRALGSGAGGGASGNGGAVCAQGLSLAVRHCARLSSQWASNNSAETGSGGFAAVWSGGEVNVDNCSVRSNRARVRGGGVHAYNAQVHLHSGAHLTENAFFELNDSHVAQHRGAAVSVQVNWTDANLVTWLRTDSKVLIENHVAMAGGAISLVASPLPFPDLVRPNSGNRPPGLVMPAARLESTTLRNNIAVGMPDRYVDPDLMYGGGAVFASGFHLAVNRSQFEQNRADKDAPQSPGGAISLSHARMTVEHSRFRNGSAIQGGGAFFAESSATDVRNCSFESNGYYPGSSEAAEVAGAIALRVDTEGEAPPFAISHVVAHVSHSNVYSNNYAQWCGAVAAVGAHFSSTNDVFVGNEASVGGAACVANNATMTFSRTDFRSNTAQLSAGAVYAMNGSNLRISGGDHEDNVAGRDGGGFAHIVASVFHASNGARFHRNAARAGGRGGVVSVSSVDPTSTYARVVPEVHATNCTFDENVADEAGGVLYVSSEYAVRVRFDGSRMHDNGVQTRTGGRGGAVSMAGPGSRLHFQNSSLDRNNCSTWGGAVFVGAGTRLTAAGSKFRNNTVTGQLNTTTVNATTAGAGGAIYDAGTNTTMSLQQSVFSGNLAPQGGAILSAIGFCTDVTLADCMFVANTAAFAHGGAVSLTVGENHTVLDDDDNLVDDDTELLHACPGAHIARSTFRDNVAAFYGGAMYISSDVRLQWSVLSDTSLAGSTNNSVRDSTFEMNLAGDMGGAVHVEGDLHMQHVNVSGNEALGDGGGVSVFGLHARMRAVNVTWQSNVANRDGGAVWLESIHRGHGWLCHGCVFAENGAGHHGGALATRVVGGEVGETLTLSWPSSVFTGNSANESGGAIDAFVSGKHADIELSGRFESNMAITADALGGAVSLTVKARASAHLVNSPQFVQNTARGGGGAVFVRGAGNVGTLDIESGSIFDGNRALDGRARGGAVLVRAAGLNVNATTFRNNNAPTCGGALAMTRGAALQSAVSLTEFDSNRADLGGAMCLEDASPNTGSEGLVSSGTRFVANEAYAAGAALHLWATNATIRDCEFVDNTARSAVQATDLDTFTAGAASTAQALLSALAEAGGGGGTISVWDTGVNYTAIMSQLASSGDDTVVRVDVDDSIFVNNTGFHPSANVDADVQSTADGMPHATVWSSSRNVLFVASDCDVEQNEAPYGTLVRLMAGTLFDVRFRHNRAASVVTTGPVQTLPFPWLGTHVQLLLCVFERNGPIEGAASIVTAWPHGNTSVAGPVNGKHIRPNDTEVSVFQPASLQSCDFTGVQRPGGHLIVFSDDVLGPLASAPGESEVYDCGFWGNVVRNDGYSALVQAGLGYGQKVGTVGREWVLDVRSPADFRIDPDLIFLHNCSDWLIGAGGANEFCPAPNVCGDTEFQGTYCNLQCNVSGTGLYYQSENASGNAVQLESASELILERTQFELLELSDPQCAFHNATAQRGAGYGAVMRSFNDVLSIVAPVATRGSVCNSAACLAAYPAGSTGLVVSRSEWDSDGRDVHALSMLPSRFASDGRSTITEIDWNCESHDPSAFCAVVYGFAAADELVVTLEPPTVSNPFNSTTDIVTTCSHIDGVAEEKQILDRLPLALDLWSAWSGSAMEARIANETSSPTAAPTAAPSQSPAPSLSPNPSMSPTTLSAAPTEAPTAHPTTVSAPSSSPTASPAPTAAPSTPPKRPTGFGSSGVLLKATPWEPSRFSVVAAGKGFVAAAWVQYVNQSLLPQDDDVAATLPKNFTEITLMDLGDADTVSGLPCMGDTGGGATATELSIAELDVLGAMNLRSHGPVIAAGMPYCGPHGVVVLFSVQEAVEGADEWENVSLTAAVLDLADNDTFRYVPAERGYPAAMGNFLSHIDRFGLSTAVMGDWNADGLAELAVTARNCTSSATEDDRDVVTFVFSLSTESAAEVGRLFVRDWYFTRSSRWDTETDRSHLGAALTGHADLNGRLYMGAPDWDGTSGGLVYDIDLQTCEVDDAPTDVYCQHVCTDVYPHGPSAYFGCETPFDTQGSSPFWTGGSIACAATETSAYAEWKEELYQYVTNGTLPPKLTNDSSGPVFTERVAMNYSGFVELNTTSSALASSLDVGTELTMLCALYSSYTGLWSADWLVFPYAERGIHVARQEPLSMELKNVSQSVPMGMLGVEISVSGPPATASCRILQSGPNGTIEEYTDTVQWSSSGTNRTGVVNVLFFESALLPDALATVVCEASEVVLDPVCNGSSVQTALASQPLVRLVDWTRNVHTEISKDIEQDARALGEHEQMSELCSPVAMQYCDLLAALRTVARMGQYRSTNTGVVLGAGASAEFELRAPGPVNDTSADSGLVEVWPGAGQLVLLGWPDRQVVRITDDAVQFLPYSSASVVLWGLDLKFEHGRSKTLVDGFNAYGGVILKDTDVFDYQGTTALIRSVVVLLWSVGFHQLQHNSTPNASTFSASAAAAGSTVGATTGSLRDLATSSAPFANVSAWEQEQTQLDAFVQAAEVARTALESRTQHWAAEVPMEHGRSVSRGIGVAASAFVSPRPKSGRSVPSATSASAQRSFQASSSAYTETENRSTGALVWGAWIAVDGLTVFRAQMHNAALLHASDILEMNATDVSNVTLTGAASKGLFVQSNHTGFAGGGAMYLPTPIHVSCATAVRRSTWSFVQMLGTPGAAVFFSDRATRCLEVVRLQVRDCAGEDALGLFYVSELDNDKAAVPNLAESAQKRATVTHSSFRGQLGGNGRAAVSAVLTVDLNDTEFVHNRVSITSPKPTTGSLPSLLRGRHPDGRFYMYNNTFESVLDPWVVVDADTTAGVLSLNNDYVGLVSVPPSEATIVQCDTTKYFGSQYCAETATCESVDHQATTVGVLCSCPAPLVGEPTTTGCALPPAEIRVIPTVESYGSIEIGAAPKPVLTNGSAFMVNVGDISVDVRLVTRDQFCLNMSNLDLKDVNALCNSSLPAPTAGTLYSETNHSSWAILSADTGTITGREGDVVTVRQCSYSSAVYSVRPQGLREGLYYRDFVVDTDAEKGAVGLRVQFTVTATPVLRFSNTSVYTDNTPSAVADGRTLPSDAELLMQVRPFDHDQMRIFNLGGSAFTSVIFSNVTAKELTCSPVLLQSSLPAFAPSPANFSTSSYQHCQLTGLDEGLSAGEHRLTVTEVSTGTTYQELTLQLTCPGSMVQVDGICTCPPGYERTGTECKTCGFFYGHTFFKDTFGDTGCEECPANAISNDSISCSCGADWVRDNETDQCVCDRGRYFDDNGQTDDGESACVPCAAGTYKDTLGNQACVNCPTTGMTSAEGAAGVVDCECEAETYFVSHDGADECAACLEGAQCGEDGLTVESIEVLPGFWRARKDSELLYICPVEAACAGAAEDTWGDSLCENGHQGVRCSVCQRNFYQDYTGICLRCSPESLRRSVVLVVVLFCLLFGGVTYAIMFMCRKASELENAQYGENIGGGSGSGVGDGAAGEASFSNVVGRLGLALRYCACWCGVQVCKCLRVRAPQSWTSVVAGTHNRRDGSRRLFKRMSFESTMTEVRRPKRGGGSGTSPRSGRRNDGGAEHSVTERRQDEMSYAGSVGGAEGSDQSSGKRSPRRPRSPTSSIRSPRSPTTSPRSGRSRHGSGASNSLTRNQLRWRNVVVKGKILFVFFQVLLLFQTSFTVDYPDNYLRFLDALSFIEFDWFRVAQMECVVEGRFAGKLVVSTIMPLTVGLFLVLIHAWSTHHYGANTKRQRYIRDTLVTAYIVFTYVIFPSVTNTVFRTFSCEEIDGEWLLRADYSINCRTDAYYSLRSYAIFMVCVYPLGIPAMYYTIMWVNRTDVNAKKYDPSMSTSLAVTHREAQCSHLRFLFDPFKLEFWHFEVLECGRKLALTGFVVFVSDASVLQIATGVGVSVLAVVAYAYTRPYLFRSNNFFAIYAHSMLCLTLLGSMLIKVNTQETRDDGVLFRYNNDAVGIMLILCNVSVIMLAMYMILKGLLFRVDKDGKALLAGYVPDGRGGYILDEGQLEDDSMSDAADFEELEEIIRQSFMTDTTGAGGKALHEHPSAGGQDEQSVERGEREKKRADERVLRLKAALALSRADTMEINANHDEAEPIGSPPRGSVRTKLAGSMTAFGNRMSARIQRNSAQGIELQAAGKQGGPAAASAGGGASAAAPDKPVAESVRAPWAKKGKNKNKGQSAAEATPTRRQSRGASPASSSSSPLSPASASDSNAARMDNPKPSSPMPR